MPPLAALHSLRFLLFLTALLYGGVIAHATEAPQTQSAPAGTDPTVAPHIALLLPTGSDVFMKPAEAVRAGCLEALKKQGTRTLPLRLYPVDDNPQHVVSAYRLALSSGARIVVGPLTRNAVTALATASEIITVPTLALNVPNRAAASAVNLFTLSLQLEAEARQVARLAYGDGRRKALTVSDQSVISRRMRDAFAEEFKRAGGYHIADYVYVGDAAGGERLRQAAATGAADMLFVAVDAPRFRALRATASMIPAYGTSQLNPGNASTGNADVPDARFIDMPWMVQPDHPAVMVYAQASPARRSDDLERLYALGIDACRVAQDMLAGKRDIDIDGVTGRLTLGLDRQFHRALLVTLIAGGKIAVLGEARP